MTLPVWRVGQAAALAGSAHCGARGRSLSRSALHCPHPSRARGRRPDRATRPGTARCNCAFVRDLRCLVLEGRTRRSRRGSRRSPWQAAFALVRPARRWQRHLLADRHGGRTPCHARSRPSRPAALSQSASRRSARSLGADLVAADVPLAESQHRGSRTQRAQVRVVPQVHLAQRGAERQRAGFDHRAHVVAQVATRPPDQDEFVALQVRPATRAAASCASRCRPWAASAAASVRQAAV